jgi:serine/threonine-protein kinase
MTSARRIGKYEIFEPFAAGGMATVHYGAELLQGGARRIVAIKRVETFADTSEHLAAALVTEARIAAHVKHPNVTAALDLLVEEREVAFVMEYVDGPSLATLDRRLRSRDERVALPILLAIVVDALRGLHALHTAVDDRGRALGLVHRDVTPHNILVGTDGVAKVADFGVAKGDLTRPRTVTGEIKGKIRYLAPEQVHGTASPRSDLFSMGVTLWECIVGRSLFAGATDPEILAQVLVEPIRMPSELGIEAPADVERVLMRALARAPEKRMASAAEMADALASGSTTPATHEEVARYVMRECGGEIEARAARVDVLRGDARGNAAVTADAPVKAAPSPARGFSRSLAVLGAVVTVIVIATMTIAFRSSPTRSDAAAVSSSAAAVPASIASPAPDPAPLAAPTPAPSAPVIPAARPVAPTTIVPARSGLPARANGKESCRPPYYLDSDGRKRFKEECF